MFGIAGAITSKMGPKELKKGQIWEYREFIATPWMKIPEDAVSRDDVVSCVGTAAEILDIQTLPGFMGFPTGRTVKVRFIKSDGSSPHDVGDELEFAAENFGKNHFFSLIFDPEVAPEEEKHGVFCSKCGQYYEHAIFRSDFMCWGCRNGY